MGAARPQFVLGAGRSAGDGQNDTSGDSAPHFGHGHDVGSFPVRSTTKGPCVGHENGHSMSHAGRATETVDVDRRHRLRRLHAGGPAPTVRRRRGLHRASEPDRQHASRDRGSNNLLHEELLQSVVAGRTAPGSGRASSPSRSVHRMRAISSRPAAPRSPRADEPGAGRGESRTARQAPQRGGRSAVIAHPDSVRSANRRSARPWALVSQTKPPAPRRFRGRAPAARNPCWSHCPFPGLIGTITPALRGGTSRAAPHTFEGH